MEAAAKTALFLSLSLLSLTPTAKSEPTLVLNVCDNSTKFTPNSQYHTNLNTVLQSLSSNATAPGTSLFFSTSSATAGADAVYGLFLCRGDQNATTCRDCVSMATTTDLPKIYCANRKVAIIWYDECMVRYSDQPIVGKLEMSSGGTLVNADNVKGNSTMLNLLLVDVFNNSTAQAAAGDKYGKKFAVKQVNFTKTTNLYTMVQCTPDLSAGDCSQCLNSEIPKVLVKKEGAQVLRPSCMARYETYPFYIGAIAVPMTGNSTGNGTIIGRRDELISSLSSPLFLSSRFIFYI